jgi:chromosome segregation ATPase
MGKKKQNNEISTNEQINSNTDQKDLLIEELIKQNETLRKNNLLLNRMLDEEKKKSEEDLKNEKARHANLVFEIIETTAQPKAEPVDSQTEEQHNVNIEDLNKQIDEQQNEITALTKQLEDKDNELKTLIGVLQGVQDNLYEKGQELSKLKNTKQSPTESNSSNKIENNDKKIKELQDELKQAKDKLSELNKKISGQQKKGASETRKDIKQSSQLERTQKELNDSKDKLNELQTKLKKLEEKTKLLEELQAEKIILEQELTKSSDNLKAATNPKIKELEKELKNANESKKKLEADISTLQTKCGQYKESNIELKEKLTNFKKEKQDIVKQIDTYQSLIKTVETKITNQKKQSDLVAKDYDLLVSDREKLREVHNNLIKDYRELQEKYNKAKNDAIKIVSLQHEALKISLNLDGAEDKQELFNKIQALQSQCDVLKLSLNQGLQGQEEKNPGSQNGTKPPYTISTSKENNCLVATSDDIKNINEANILKLVLQLSESNNDELDSALSGCSSD